MTKPAALAALFATTAFAQPEDAVGFLLWRAAHRYQREIDRACAEVDLTHLQFVVLVIAAWLGREGDVVTQSAVASFSGIHRMQVSTMLSTLEAKELVVRDRSLADVRAKHVALTATGVRALRRAMGRVEKAQQRFFGPDHGAAVALHDALRRIVATWTVDPD